MSWHYLQGQEEVFWEGNSLDGAPSALSRLIPTAVACCLHDNGTACSRLSRFGMAFTITFFIDRCKIAAWIKNTDMANRATASSAESCSRQETKEANRSAVRMLAVAFFKRGKPQGRARSAVKILSRHALAMRHAQEHAAQSCGFHEERLTQWLMSGRGLLCSAAHSLQDACGTRPTERHRFSGIRLKNYGRTLKRTSSQECRGTTTGRSATNGA